MKILRTTQGLDEVINAEATDLKRKFEQAFSLLKSSKGTSLTDMPWYMIIGSPGSGKTTLLSNSGLKFPLYKEFSNQAIQGRRWYQKLRLVDYPGCSVT